MFDGCDNASDFTLLGDAFAAAQALDTQVFIDSGTGQFDSNPLLTRGCTAIPLNYCAALVPGSIMPSFGGQFEVSGNTAANNVSGANSVGIFDMPSSRDTSGTTDPAEYETWAKFTPAQPVPEPASMLLFASGFGAAILRLRRRRA